MKYAVFHKEDSQFIRDYDEESCSFPDGYKKVAEVVADSLEDVFCLTNHIDHSWTKNPGVTSFRIRPRSTSVEDVVVDETGQAFHCNGCGWASMAPTGNSKKGE